MSELTLLLVAVSGWLVAGALFGLWWGERGRRMDAQRREGVIRVDRPTPAKTIAPGEEPSPHQAELAEPPTRFVEDMKARTGCDDDEAREEWRRLVAASQGDRSTPWSPEI